MSSIVLVERNKGPLWVKKIRNYISRPIQAIALEDADHNTYLVYNGHNQVHGIFTILAIRPYAKEVENVFSRPVTPYVEAWEKDNTIYIVHESGLFESYRVLTGSEFLEYEKKNQGDLFYNMWSWKPQNAQRAWMEAKRRVG